MKITFLKGIGTMALAILMLTMFGQISVSAQEKEENPNEAKNTEQRPDASAERGNAGRLEGVWNIQVTARNCQTGGAIRTFLAMQTYLRGGTMSDFGTGNPPSLRGPGMGIWSYQAGRQYTTAFQFFRYHPDGTLAGKQISRAQVEMSRDGNSYTSTATAQVFDTAGTVIATNCSTAAAARFE